jgi:hypothetical protein
MRACREIRASFFPCLNGAQPLRGTGHGVPYVFARAQSYNGTLSGRNDLPAFAEEAGVLGCYSAAWPAF